MANKKAISFSFSALAFVLGCFIYLCLRQPPIIFQPLLGDEIMLSLRNFSEACFSSLYIPDWIKYNLPDMLWMFSLIMIIFTLWDFKINLNSIFWLVACFISGLVFEFLQFLHVVTGNFDFYDILFICMGALLPFLFNFKESIHGKSH